MFLSIIKILLFFWLVSVVSKWYTRHYLNKNKSQEFKQKNPDNNIGNNYKGPVQDADYEEID